MTENKDSKKVKVIHAHPGAGIFVRQSALSYLENDMLEYFLTTFVSHEKYFLSNFITKVVPQIKRDISRKAIDELPFEKLKLYPYKELIRLFASRYTSPMVIHRIWEWAELAFDSWVANVIAQESKKQQIDAIHVYEHAALSSLQKAKQKGIFTIFEQASQHHSFFAPIAKQQLEKYPELKSDETNILVDTKYDKYNQRKDKELQLADLVICNSSFTKRTLIAATIDEKKIQVIPHGFPKILTELNTDSKSNLGATKQKPVIFLNAGTQNLRKGVHLLYNAWRKANFSSQEAELWLIGRSSLPKSLTEDLQGNVKIKDSIPRDELMQLYKEADVFVLPTLADGFAMVISESMSQGVPVITTQNSMAPDFITHQKNGWIVPAGDEDALLQQMKWCVENRHLLPKIGYEAIQIAKNWQWEDFRQKTATTVKEQILIYNEQKRTK